jgi:hypothetical protein
MTKYQFFLIQIILLLSYDILRNFESYKQHSIKILEAIQLIEKSSNNREASCKNNDIHEMTFHNFALVADLGLIY